MPSEHQPRPRALLLARASLARADSVSLPDQLAAMTDHCRARGYDPVHTIESEGVRGTRQAEQRADLTEVVALADAGAIDLVCVFKLDRLARNLRVQENVVYDLERHGVRVESATEPMANTPEGRQMLGMWAELFSRQLRERMTRVVAWQVRQGKHQGAAPLGYVRGDDDRLVVDEDRRAAVVDAYRWRLEGVGSTIIRARLIDRHGLTLPDKTILDMLANPVYAGAVTGPGGLVVWEAHEPMVDRATWDGVQRRNGRWRAARTKRASSWLEGLAVCGCGAPLYLVSSATTWRGRQYENWKFRCKTTLGNGAAPCDQPRKSISRRRLEAAIADQLAAVLSRESALSIAERLADARAATRRDHPHWTARRRALSATIARQRRRQRAINEAIEDGRRTRAEGNALWRAAQAAIDAAEADMAAGPTPVDPALLAERQAVMLALAESWDDLLAWEPSTVTAALRQLGWHAALIDGRPLLVCG